jgi:hypothetical protein
VREDSDYPDRVLISAVDVPSEVYIQIRNLDTAVIRSLGITRGFAGTRSQDDIDRSIREAVAEKANVDAALKGKTVLLLMLPGVQGKMVKRELQRRKYDRRGFREIWVAPFRESALAQLEKVWLRRLL